MLEVPGDSPLRRFRACRSADQFLAGPQSFLIRLDMLCEQIRNVAQNPELCFQLH